MIIIFLFIAVSGLITFLTHRDNSNNTVGAVTVTGIISTVILVIIVASSYTSYLDIRAQYDAVINQYKGAVTVYADYATLDMEKATFTDFKYQGYQENISKVIVDLRNEIIIYNKVLIKKRILDKNPLFNWLIIAPDKDMKIINIVE